MPGIPPNSATITEFMKVLPPSVIDSLVSSNTVNGSPSAVANVEVTLINFDLSHFYSS